MPNFYPILFKFCAYVNNMFMYNMQRDREFPMKTNNLAALFLGLFESPSYYCVWVTWASMASRNTNDLVGRQCCLLTKGKITLAAKERVSVPFDLIHMLCN